MPWSPPLRRLTMAVVFAGLGLAGTTGASPGPKALKLSTIHWSRGQASAQASDGSTVALGLDADLQHTAERLLSRAQPIAGALAIVDARTGQVLAAAEVGPKKGGSLLVTPLAPAASLFKIVTTAALFERTDVTPMTQVCTHGGKQDISAEHLISPAVSEASCGLFAHALGVSRNAAYAQLATQKLSRSDLLETASMLGFSANLALDVAGKVGSLQAPYNDLAFARTAVGFENTKLSVFGGAQLALTVASGGVIVPMHFQKTPSPVADRRRAMSERTARRIRDAMEVTIHSGTARESFVTKAGKSTVGPVQVAGKTGTLKPQSGAPTASWFIGFAPSENPRVIVSVLLQNPDKWVQKGHSLGRDLLLAYLKQQGVAGLPIK